MLLHAMITDYAPPTCGTPLFYVCRSLLSSVPSEVIVTPSAVPDSHVEQTSILPSFSVT